MTIIDFGTALGEACADDGKGFEVLLQRAISCPDDRVCLLALGWSRRPDAVEFLSHTVLDLATHSERWPYALDATLAAQRALEHADQAACKRVVASMTLEQACRAFGKPSIPDLIRLRLDAVDSAPDAQTRRIAEISLCVSCVVAPWRLPGGDVARVLSRLQSAARRSDPDLTVAALDATSEVLVGPLTAASDGGYFGPEGTLKEAAVTLGTADEVDSVLDRCVADLATGDLSFGSSHPRDGECAAFAGDPRGRARSDLLLPARLPGNVVGVPVRVRGAWTAHGLRLRLTNEGERRYAVNPVAFRYGRAERVTTTNSPRGGEATTETHFVLRFGVVGTYPYVPASVLVVLKPGESYECEVPVRAEFRVEPHVDLAIEPLSVERPALAPPIAFEATPLF